MPQTTSAKKALRQNKRRRSANLAKMRVIKETVKNYKKSPNKELLSSAYKKIDKAAKANILTRNKAARLKSGLAKLGAKK
ncbi:MAG: 30S ribosomal protein S20 [Candidatus Harrisonbacteria bacterium CG10_big_fil_rev_8_21_14_0_10_40_38]|uniref:Small ribosomal subunit protein bS20 n=1 Tax=Candidatus Harrisonbacteria bacterium CG10_big_fil_rev_8_21_14_0_10_40_38 TaxID=1974583 RepID=A0A2H0URB5_9BACT|nr:MAG: 30S ribosomal protein S20 [Candidatus Harrisonbacteria bacterium CG10_big_fil_rev_8_21_14_0_10_40_38]